MGFCLSAEIQSIEIKIMRVCPVPLLDINLGLLELSYGSCFVLLPKVDFHTASETCASINGTLPVFLEDEESWFHKMSLSGPRKSTLELEKLWSSFPDNEEERTRKDKLDIGMNRLDKEERYFFCQFHRQTSENKSFFFPEKIGEFENWDENEYFKSGMQICAATFRIFANFWIQPTFLK